MDADPSSNLERPRQGRRLRADRLGLTLIFGTLGVVNFAHGALFMIGAFCAVTLNKILSLSCRNHRREKTDFLGNPLKFRRRMSKAGLVPRSGTLIDWSVPILDPVAIPSCCDRHVMERGLIKHFYKRPHADQILVTFGLAIVLRKSSRPITAPTRFRRRHPQPLPAALTSGADRFRRKTSSIRGGARLFLISASSSERSSPSCNSRPSAWLCAPACRTARRSDCSGSTSNGASRSCSGSPPSSPGLAGVMYTPILPPDYHMGMDFLVLSFVVVVVGGMGSLSGAVLAGFLLGILQSLRQ
jgi:branched-chain amino acid transport system permease protein